MINLRLLVLSLICLMLSSCGLKIGTIDVGKMVDTGVAIVKASRDYTPEEEVILGNTIAAQLLGASKYYENEVAQEYVSNVGQWLVMQLPEQQYDWQFIVLEDEMFNAYTAPGGLVFINTGMLEQLQTEAQLAAVLSHEIIHSYQKHHIKTIQKGAKSQAWSGALSIAADQSRNREFQANRAVWTSVASQVSNIYFRGFDQNLELESDHLGTYLMVKAGYDPYAMLEVLQMIQGMEPGDVWFKQFYSTHPEPDQRIKAVFDIVDGKLGELEPVAVLQKRYSDNKPVARP